MRPRAQAYKVSSNEAQGVTVGLADLLIGVTALHHGHEVLTSSTRHFTLVPGLEVVEL